MSVLWHYDPDEPPFVTVRECFVCHEPIVFYPALYWACVHHLFLHLRCTLHLVVALCRDIDEVKHATGERPLWGKEP
jgi:hypothetical protein